MEEKGEHWQKGKMGFKKRVKVEINIGIKYDQKEIELVEMA